MSSFPAELWRVCTEVAPSLLLGLLVAGILHVLINKDRIFRYLGKPGFMSTLKASLWGVPLPLCSCGVIPTALSLRRDGASPGATVAFLVSTPQTGVDSILVTAGMLGWPLAIVKMCAAFIAGLASGVLTDLKADPLHAQTAVSSATTCTVEKMGSAPGRFWNHAFGVIYRDIYRWLAFGIVVSALLSTFIPADSLAGVGWLHGPAGMLAALLIGIPLYVCSTASVPIAAGLVAAGFPPGAAIVFLMAGPATNAATMGAVRKTLGNRVFWIYIGVITAVSLAAGFLFEGVIGTGSTVGASHWLHAVPAWLPQVSAILMTAGMAWWAMKDAVALLSGASAKRSPGAFTIAVGGMSCGSCERRVRDALLALQGVRSVSISRDDGLARIDAVPGFDRSKALAAVSGLGYEATDA